MVRRSREQWKGIPGWPDYEVSSLGRVRSWKTATCAKPGAILKWQVGYQGYAQVNLHHNGRRASLPVHRLVALAFLGPKPEGQMVLHGDGDVWNPALGNLRYGTAKENYEDAVAHGTHTHGERHGCAKLTEEQVQQIRRLRAAGLVLREIAKMFALSISNTSDICTRKIWTHV